MMYEPSIFRAYDMRGTYPTQMNEQVAYAAGQSFVHVMGAKTVAVGRDVRTTGESMLQSLIKGITDAGASVINVGIISTEMLYFAAATLDCDGGITVTASHNPAQWNGLKFIGKGAEPLTGEAKLGELYKFMQEGHKLSEFTKGSVKELDLLSSYAHYLQHFTPTLLPQMKLVANVNFGANGKVVDAVTKDLPLEIIRINWEENGTFPKGTPNPMLESNRNELSQAVIDNHAQLGVAWDADADRCFFFDEQGRFFSPYHITAMLISEFAKDNGQSFVGERRLTWANLAAVAEGNGNMIFSRTGHGYIKKAMRDHNAVFGGESSGHYYFRDFFFCDSGMITFLKVLGVFAREITAGRTVGQLLDMYAEKYPTTGEINYTTPQAKDIIDAAAAKYADTEQNHEDGLTVEYSTWRFNLRSSSNEPLLRLNVEAKSKEELELRHKEINELIGGFDAHVNLGE